MYSNKNSVNILTALLVAHGIRHAVVCPGSRNAPIVHNLHQHPAITCYPVTDERSAAFFALGVAQATDEPVVVCVTSGTALLNLVPAVAEAHYQHQALVVVSADRPAAWIDQLDGQTICQPGALAPWVAKSVTLPEDDSWHCNRLVNEALIEATSACHPCVHINVPITEPLFQFDVAELPAQRVIRRYAPAVDYGSLPQLFVDDLLQAQRPLIVFGQLSPRRFHYEGVDRLFSRVIVLREALAPFTSVSHFEDVLDEAPLPDFVLHVGDAIVSKRLKAFLRRACDARMWRISLTGQVEDTFQNLNGLVVGDAECLLQALNEKVSRYRQAYANEAAAYRRQWLHLLSEARQRVAVAPPATFEAAAVSELEQQLQQMGEGFEVHYANSTAIRLANIYVHGHPVWCNRGTNGIEGSVSTAAGFAAAMTVLNGAKAPLVVCVVGDLSFFYDQNALWNQNLSGGRLRIMLLNNHGGRIFSQLSGLEQSPALDSCVAACHPATAKGICEQNDVAYCRVDAPSQLPQAVAWLLQEESQRPLLLEINSPSSFNK